MSDDLEFSKRVAFVTGAASGIGRATAELFAERGAKVVLADIGGSAGDEVVARIVERGGQAIYVETDVSSPEQVESAIKKTIETFGRLDCAVNNAGIAGESAATADCSLENWQRTIDVNLTGVFLCMKSEIPRMLEGGGGTIVNMASIAGIVAFPGSPAYCASKGGIIQLTKTAAVEYATAGVRVNAICPGVIETPMVEAAVTDEATRAMLVAGEPIGRFGESSEIAEAAVWLCSDASSFVTGHPMVVDGGWVAR